jgi:hypothetical protein
MHELSTEFPPAIPLAATTKRRNNSSMSRHAEYERLKREFWLRHPHSSSDDYETFCKALAKKLGI